MADKASFLSWQIKKINELTKDLKAEQFITRRMLDNEAREEKLIALHQYLSLVSNCFIKKIAHDSKFFGFKLFRYMT